MWVSTSESECDVSEFREYTIAWLIVVVVGIISYNFHQTQPTSVVVLNPLTATLKLGESVLVSTTAYDELGNTIPDAVVQWLPTADSGEHCVSITSGVITARIVGICGVGALSVTNAGKVILHEVPITVTVVGKEPSPMPTVTPTPRPPCSTRLPNGKCKKGCTCL